MRTDAFSFTRRLAALALVLLLTCALAPRALAEGGEPSARAAGVLPCSETDLASASELRLNVSSLKLRRGTSFVARACLYPIGSGGVVSWSSSKTSVATVSAGGRITALKKGSCYITATCGGQSRKIKVIVLTSVRRTEKLDIRQSTVSLQKDKTCKLTVTVSGDSTGRLWYSTDPRVASVSQEGLVTAEREGSCFICCRTADGASDRCRVVVTESPRPDIYGAQLSSVVGLGAYLRALGGYFDFYTSDSDILRVGELREYTTIQSAIDAAEPGSVIIVDGGDYHEALEIEKSGEQTGYIRLLAAQNERVRVLGSESEGEALLSISGAGCWYISGLELGGASGSGACGVRITPKGEKGAHDIILNRLKITNIRALASESDLSTANGILCLGSGKTKAGTLSNISILGCEVSDLETGGSEAVGVRGNCAYVNIIDCNIYRAGDKGIFLCGNKGGSSGELDRVRYCTAAGNLVFDCVSAQDGNEGCGIYIDGAREALLRSNVVYDCEGGIGVGAELLTELYPTRNIVLEANTVYGCLGVALSVGGSANDKGWCKQIFVEDNVLVGASDWAELFEISKVNGVYAVGNAFASYRGGSEIKLSEDISALYMLGIELDGNLMLEGEQQINSAFVDAEHHIYDLRQQG